MLNSSTSYLGLSLCLDGELISKENIKAVRQSFEEQYQEDSISDLKAEVLSFLESWFSSDSFIELQTSGSTGKPKIIKAKKEALLTSASLTCEALGLKASTNALLCISPKYIGGMMMIVRAMFCQMNLVLAPVQSNPLLYFCTKDNKHDFFSEHFVLVALVPMQVQMILANVQTRSLFMQIEQVLIGGASVSKSLENNLKELPNRIYSTYGMTETLSHIALRQINGQKPNPYYKLLPSISVRQDNDGCLQILAPYISKEYLPTNDIVRLFACDEFEVLGRRDNIVNSGGLKLQIEELEEELIPYINVPFALSSQPDELLGDALVLLIEGELDNNLLFQKLKRELNPYHLPKRIISSIKLPKTANEKIDRQACRQLVQSFATRD